MTRAIYYDLESTSAQPATARIIEIAAYDPLDGRTFCEFVQPQCPIPAEVTAITSITDAMVAEADLFEVVGKQFIEFCGPEAILIAHNNERFDKILLDAECQRCQLNLPYWKYVDSLKWSRKYRSDLPSHSLQSLREYYGFVANQAHRALDDVMMLHQIFSFMIDDLSIEIVYDLLNQTTEMQHMPFGKHQGKPLSEIPIDYVKWLKTSGALDKGENKDLKEAFTKQGMLR